MLCGGFEASRSFKKGTQPALQTGIQTAANTNGDEGPANKKGTKGMPFGKEANKAGCKPKRETKGLAEGKQRACPPQRNGNAGPALQKRKANERPASYSEGPAICPLTNNGNKRHACPSKMLMLCVGCPSKGRQTKARPVKRKGNDGPVAALQKGRLTKGRPIKREGERRLCRSNKNANTIRNELNEGPTLQKGRKTTIQ